jgi:hypothetical protein
MTEAYQPIADLLRRVRTRWRTLMLLRAAVRAALMVSAILAAVILTAQLLPPSPLALALLGSSGMVLTILVIVWTLLPARDVPSDIRLARFVEERVDGLEQRLISAVDVATQRDEDARTAFSTAMVRDAARTASEIDPAVVVPPDHLRRVWFQATAALVLAGVLAFLGRHVGRQALDAASLTIFPSSVSIDVTPGNARLQAGSNLVIRAHLVGNSAPVAVQLLRTEGDRDDWRSVEMARDENGLFTASLNALSSSFKYRVAAGSATSDTFTVGIVRAPVVTRIDVAYSYPKSFGLPPRTEVDGGDIYAPAGTSVQLRIHTDAPAASGRMLLGSRGTVELSPESGARVLSGSLKVASDDSYRVTLADSEGISSHGDTEYFIRIMEDRSPEVHVVRPASDRRVTPLEEVDIEAEASDDFGIASLDLVYSIQGAKETSVPIPISKGETTVTAGRTLYLEDLDLDPGDFVSYYVRARDLARGKPSSEARSDIFFLEVRNFEEEFTLAQSQAAMGGGASNPELEELIAAQKDVIVATWKLERRSQAARGAQSAQDIRAVARAEEELRTRVRRVATAFRAGVMRDPRARVQGGRGVPPDGQPQGELRAGQTLSEEDAMTAAVTAMTRAVNALDALKTADAIPPEMEALNHLFKAQADVKRRQVQRQQAGGGSGSNRATQDLSSLFDKELARHQETNYETLPRGQAASEEVSAIDQIRELARRQDELLNRQQDLAQRLEQIDGEERKRELERLSREQNELRQRADELARQLGRQSEGRQQGEQRSRGQQGQSGAQGQQGQQPSGQDNRSPSTTGREDRMRGVSEEMRASASGLRRQNADEASARSARALEKLRELERELMTASPDGRRRALGDLQLEARQIADAERQLAAEAERSRPQGGTSTDAWRRLAGEQERLAERVRRLRDGLKSQAQPPAGNAGESANGRPLRDAAGEASREIDRQRLAERMEQSAQVLRAQAGESSPNRTSSGGQEPRGSGMLRAGEEIARSLDRLADRLASASQSGDEESRRLTARLASVQELRERLDDLTRRLAALERNGTAQQDQRSSRQTPDDRSSGSPRQSDAGQGTPGGTSADAEQLRSEMDREITALRALLDQARRDEAAQSRGGSGVTFEGQGMIRSAPGTEAFKQDFSRWQELSRQATIALDWVESAASRRLSEKAGKDRLTAGVDDRAPVGYEQQVESYFKALASKTKP